MTKARVFELVGGGPQDGAMLPATRQTDAHNIVDVSDKDRPENVHFYQGTRDEQVAHYCGCFPRTIRVHPEPRDDETDSTYGQPS